MPFKSKKQARYTFWAEKHGKVKPGTAEEWADHTKDISKLPEKVAKSSAEPSSKQSPFAMAVPKGGSCCDKCIYSDNGKCKNSNFIKSEAGAKKSGDNRFIDPESGKEMPGDEFCCNFYDWDASKKTTETNKIAKSEEDLEKNWKGSILGAAVGLAGLANQIKPTVAAPSNKAPISQASPSGAPLRPRTPPKVSKIEIKQAKSHPVDIFEGLDPDLHPISFLESSYGKNIDHAKNSKGEFETAFGHLGFKPETAYEIYNHSNNLKKKYPDLEDKTKFLNSFKSNPRMYNVIASNQWEHLKSKLGSPERAALGWRYGLGAALKHTADQIDKEGYVQKYKKLYDEGGIYKSTEDLEKGAMARLAPFQSQNIGTRTKQILNNWQEGDLRYRNINPPMDKNARIRALHTLSGHTTTRKNSQGEREFLLHRGMGLTEFINNSKPDQTINHDTRTSWTPKHKIAASFGQEYEGDSTSRSIASAWVNEKHIHHIPRQYGNVRSETDPSSGKLKYAKTPNEYGYEHEIIVNPNHNSKLATKEEIDHALNTKANLDRHISNKVPLYSRKISYKLDKLNKSEHLDLSALQNAQNRKNKEGQTEYLLYRGMDKNEYSHSVHGQIVNHIDFHTSWSPDIKVASKYAQSHQGEIVSAWVSAKYITRIKQGDYLQVEVAPNHHSILESISAPMGKSEVLKKGINQPPSQRWHVPDLNDEKEEFERVGKDHNIAASHLMHAASSGKLALLDENTWSKLENTESYGIQHSNHGLSHAQKLANGYGKNWSTLVDALKNNKGLPAPIILHRQNRPPTLVSGNTRLMFSKALGIQPHVLHVQMPNINKSEVLEKGGFSIYYNPENPDPIEVMRNWRDKNMKPRDHTHMVPIEKLWPHREYEWDAQNHRAGVVPMPPDENGGTPGFVEYGGMDKGIPEKLNEGNRWDALKGYMSKYGWKKDPAHVLVGKNGGVTVGEGNHRLAVARELGLTHVPVLYHVKDEVDKPDYSAFPHLKPKTETSDIFNKSKNFTEILNAWISHRLAEDKEPSPEPSEVTPDKQDGPTFDKILEVARFLSQKHPATQDTINEALHEHESDPYLAALYAYELSQTPENKTALLSLLGGKFTKSEPELLHPTEITSACPEAEDVVQSLKRAFNTNMASHVDLHGKHSKLSLVAVDPKTDRMYILKPDDHKFSSAKGVSDTSISQPVREAAFYHIADKFGLLPYFPRAELVLLDNKDWVGIKKLPNEYKTMDALKQQDKTLPAKLLQPYLDRGIIFKWALIDYVLGQPDRHSGNIMADPISGRVVLIDQGSAMAGKHFDPANDPKSYVPFYLRAFSGKDFNKLTPEQKIAEMPTLSAQADIEVRQWLSSLPENDVSEICREYKLSPEAYLNRLQKLKQTRGSISAILNKCWAG